MGLLSPWLSTFDTDISAIALVSLVKKINAESKIIDGIGSQSHISVSSACYLVRPL